MASVTIIRAPICSDPAEEVPKEWWHILISERRQFCQKVLPSDCRLLLFFIEDGESANWLGYGSREKYLTEGLQLNPEMVNLAVEGLKLSDPAKAQELNKMVVLGKREIGLSGGKPGPGRGHKTDGNANRFNGTTAAYTLARLDRDGKTQMAAAVRSGELSANAAALAAGFRKKRRCPHCGKEL